ncbi:rhodanese-like domain-containing protein [Paraferrimonas sp. SM1919]|uniref:rhodanese-like domain-containing protein n=1 Tax=Paraferrimonas sp. SM1919 TaxID=2662263 RepID=UPI0013D465AB|nr:rhodanese-like domain-containing protein [Paraferrimonas sp. SM1919]
MFEQYLPLMLVGLFIAYRIYKSKKAKALLANLNPNDIQLVDVRTESEFAAISAPNSLNIPVQSLMTGNTKSLDKNKTLVVYCASGMRSGSAVMWLKKQGYNAINVGTVGAVIKHLNP